MALAGSKDISEKLSELCIFLVETPYGLWITSCPVLTFPFLSVCHGPSTSKALSWGLCICYGCQSSLTDFFFQHWRGTSLVIIFYCQFLSRNAAVVSGICQSELNQVKLLSRVWNYRMNAGITQNYLSWSFFVVSACSAETEKVCKLAAEENLQPFKDMMDTFLSQGETVFQIKWNWG